MKTSDILVVLGVTIFLGGCWVPPKPISHTELRRMANKPFIPPQEPAHGKIDVYEAIARALKYNLDQQAERMQEAIRVGEFRLAGYQGLPSLVLNSAYSGRNNDLVTSSRDIFTGRVTPSTSTSTDRQILNNEIRLSWNILDFGLSYTRARQAGDRILLQREIRRRSLNRLVEDVRVAYWRAVASEQLLERLRALENKISNAISSSRSLVKEGNTAPIVAVAYERDLLEIRREIESVEGHLQSARSQLAALMSLPQNEKFVLSREKPAIGSAHLNVPIANLIRIAFFNRPEVREIMYELRINQNEARAALLQFLPGIETSISGNSDSNSLLYNPNWVSWSSKIVWNLMRTFQYPENKKLIRAQKELLRTRAMALTVAVMSQVYISRARYVHAQKELKTAEELLSAQNRFLRLLKASASTDLASEQELIRENMKTLIAEVKFDIAYADLQAAYGSMFASLGLDTYPLVDIRRSSLKEISNVLINTWIGKGDLSLIEQMQVHVPEYKSKATPMAVKMIPNKGKVVSNMKSSPALKAPLDMRTKGLNRKIPQTSSTSQMMPVSPMAVKMIPNKGKVVSNMKSSMKPSPALKAPVDMKRKELNKKTPQNSPTSQMMPVSPMAIPAYPESSSPNSPKKVTNSKSSMSKNIQQNKEKSNRIPVGARQ